LYSEPTLKKKEERLSEAEMHRMFPGQSVWPPVDKRGEHS
jgi:hypothetical protein